MKIFLLIFLLMIGVVIAETNFGNSVGVVITNDNTTCNVNVTTEENQHHYGCFFNSSNSFIFNLVRNVTCINQCDLTPFNNFSSKVDGVLSKVDVVTDTCNTILKQYGDINSYFKLYTSCNVENELCKKDTTDKSTKIQELTTFKNDYQTCSTNLNNVQSNLQNLQSNIVPTLQGNLTSCNNNLQKTNKSKFFWGLMGGVIIGLIAYMKERTRNPVTQKDRIVGLTGTTRR